MLNLRERTSIEECWEVGETLNFAHVLRILRSRRVSDHQVVSVRLSDGRLYFSRIRRCANGL